MPAGDEHGDELDPGAERRLFHARSHDCAHAARFRVHRCPDVQVTTSGSASAKYHPRQPETFGCFFNHQSNHPPSRIEALSDRIEASGPKDAEFRDRSASNVCPIATLRGLLL